MDVKTLKKYGTNQLVLKLQRQELTGEDRENVLQILKERKVDLSIIGVDKDPPRVTKTPQEIVDFIHQTLEEENTDLVKQIGKILGEGDIDYDSLSEIQINKLLKLRNMAKQGKTAPKEKTPKAEKEKKEPFVINSEQKAVLEDKNLSKSEKMRKLYELGMTVAQIADNLNTHYSFTFGVIKRHKDSKNAPKKEKKGKAKKEEDIEDELPAEGEAEGAE